MCVTEDPARRGPPDGSVGGHCADRGEGRGLRAPQRLGARRRVGRAVLWYARGVAAMKPRAAGRADELALLRRDPRVQRRRAGSSLGYLPRPTSRRAGAAPTVLGAVPARQLVLPAVASRLRPGVRGDRPSRDRAARRPGGLGPALLELLQGRTGGPSAGVRVPGLARRRWSTTRSSSRSGTARRTTVTCSCPSTLVNLEAMFDPDFTGRLERGQPRLRRRRHRLLPWRGRARGIETQPHDWVHGLVGGADPADPSWPGRCRTRARPRWTRSSGCTTRTSTGSGSPGTRPRAHTDPTDPAGSTARRASANARSSCRSPTARTWTYTPGDCSTSPRSDYEYDDLTRGAAPAGAAAQDRRGSTLAARGCGAWRTRPTWRCSARTASRCRARERDASRVQMDRRGAQQEQPRTAAMAAEARPDRVFLNLENVRGPSTRLRSTSTSAPAAPDRRTSRRGSRAASRRSA